MHPPSCIRSDLLTPVHVVLAMVMKPDGIPCCVTRLTGRKHQKAYNEMRLMTFVRSPTSPCACLAIAANRCLIPPTKASYQLMHCRRACLHACLPMELGIKSIASASRAEGRKYLGKVSHENSTNLSFPIRYRAFLQFAEPG
jgi:hypothetical protein